MAICDKRRDEEEEEEKMKFRLLDSLERPVLQPSNSTTDYHAWREYRSLYKQIMTPARFNSVLFKLL